MKLVSVAQEVARLHQQCIAAGKAFIVAGIECGKRLMIARKQTKHGEWSVWLESTGIKPSTANYYMRAFEFSVRNPKAVAYLAEQGAPFVQLLREAGIIRPCLGGGYRSEAYQRRKLLGEQQEFHFAYEEFDDQIVSLIRAPEVNDLSETSLLKLRSNLREASARVDDVLAKKTAIDIHPQ